MDKVNSKVVVMAAMGVWACTAAVAAQEMMNVAHRGLWVEAKLPQNTVEAIKAAYDAGAKVVETDFNETEAGEMICLHDIKALETMSTVAKEPAKITPVDRATINLGEKLGLKRPYRIPLLKDVLAVVPKDGVLQSEIKVYGPNYAKKFDAAVKAAGLTEKNITVSSGNAKALKDFHAKFPQYKTIWLGCGVGKKGFNVDYMIATAKDGGFDVICPGCDAAHKAGMKPADADRIRAAGFDFRFFGVNSLGSLKYAATMGITGFTCNTFLRAYEWAKEVPGVKLLPNRSAKKAAPKAQDLRGVYSDKVKTVGVVMPASIASRRDYERCKAAVEAAGFVHEVRARVYLSSVWSPNQVNDRNLPHIASRELYPGKRTIFFGAMPKGKLAAFGNAAFVNDFAPCVGHQVVKVAPGGTSYEIFTLDAASESMRVLARGRDA